MYYQAPTVGAYLSWTDSCHVALGTRGNRVRAGTAPCALPWCRTQAMKKQRRRGGEDWCENCITHHDILITVKVVLFSIFHATANFIAEDVS